MKYFNGASFIRFTFIKSPNHVPRYKNYCGKLDEKQEYLFAIPCRVITIKTYLYKVIQNTNAQKTMDSLKPEVIKEWKD
jgi:hypothetical protein